MALTRSGPAGRLAIPRIIPALRSVGDGWVLPDLPAPRWVFLLGGTLSTIGEPVGQMQRRGWTVFVHADMLRGLAPDQEGMAFLADYAGPDGIITTHSHTVLAARKAGFVTIQRLFLLDSLSITTGVAQARSARPDAVEVLPGILPEATHQVVCALPCPVIAGGLLTEAAQVDQMVAAGAAGVSTSNPRLWTHKVPAAQRVTR